MLLYFGAHDAIIKEIPIGRDAEHPSVGTGVIVAEQIRAANLAIEDHEIIGPLLREASANFHCAVSTSYRLSLTV